MRLLILMLTMLCAVFTACASAGMVQTVEVRSADAKTVLVGYLFAPDGAGPHPAIVLLHGRAGLYSSLKPGVYTADALSARHRTWGEFWAERGYLALLVDSFGPRGHAQGFPRQSYRDRPIEVSERVVRPLDAYGALRFLQAREDVVPDRVGIQGWSNGGMTVLSVMASDAPGIHNVQPGRRFRAALAQYPSCRTQAAEPVYTPYAPLLILAASADDEVSPEICRRFAESLRARGEPVEFVLYEGAHHAYDDPGKTKQSHAPNRAARLDTQLRAAAFFERHLRRGSER